MKIGIFGGTFNPPHSGHLNLCRQVKKQLGLDRILIMPACVPPHKDIEKSFVEPEKRLEMCRILFRDEGFEISDIEIKRAGTSYTVETLRGLTRDNPRDDFYLIIGSDMLEFFPHWYCWEEILSLCTVVAAARESDYTPDLKEYTPQQRAKILFINIPVISLSSTMLRKHFFAGADTSDYLPRELIEYIKANGLYDDGFSSYRRAVTDTLDTKRAYHSFCVSESAAMLAKRFGFDEKKATLAGLLHDITKNLTEDEHFDLCRNMTALEMKSPAVWHQITAPEYIKKIFGIEDEEILAAVRWHTTGRAGMSGIEKVVYTADFISEDRDYPDVDVVRKLAEESLEKAMLYTTEYTINKMVSLDRPLHPATVDCYNEMIDYLSKG